MASKKVKKKCKKRARSPMYVVAEGGERVFYDQGVTYRDAKAGEIILTRSDLSRVILTQEEYDLSWEDD